MNYSILFVIVIAILGSVALAALMKGFRHAFLVPEGYTGLLYHKGNFVEMPGVPGFVPLKNGKAGSPTPNTEEAGAS